MQLSATILRSKGWTVICFGVKKFYPYLFSRHFTLITDHKPLLSLLSCQRKRSSQASARIQRWSLYLSMFEYELQFRNTLAHVDAGGLSRLPLSDTAPAPADLPEPVLLTTHLNDSPVTADQIKATTHHDPELSSVMQYVQQGWPAPTDSALKPYFSRKAELS